MENFDFVGFITIILEYFWKAFKEMGIIPADLATKIENEAAAKKDAE